MNPKRQRLLAGVLVAVGVIVSVPPEFSHASGQSRYPDWGDNPFLIDRRKAAASTPVSTASGGLTLNGILWDPKVPSAIVNSRLVVVGDRLGPWQVLEIQKDRVVLSDGTSTQTLTVE